MAVSGRAPLAGQDPARIETCLAEFEVTAGDGPLAAPERLLSAIRREVLPVLDDVLGAPEWRDVDLGIARIEIDLGDWPDEPVWSEVRHVFATRLRAALGVNAGRRGPVETPSALPAPPQATRSAERQAPARRPDIAGVATPARRVADAGASVALARFARWLDAQPTDVEIAAVLAYLAGDEAAVEAIVSRRNPENAVLSPRLVALLERRPAARSAVDRLSAAQRRETEGESDAGAVSARGTPEGAEAGPASGRDHDESPPRPQRTAAAPRVAADTTGATVSETERLAAVFSRLGMAPDVALARGARVASALAGRGWADDRDVRSPDAPDGAGPRRAYGLAPAAVPPARETSATTSRSEMAARVSHRAQSREGSPVGSPGAGAAAAQDAPDPFASYPPARPGTGEGRIEATQGLSAGRSLEGPAALAGDPDPVSRAVSPRSPGDGDAPARDRLGRHGADDGRAAEGPGVAADGGHESSAAGSAAGSDAASRGPAPLATGEGDGVARGAQSAGGRGENPTTPPETPEAASRPVVPPVAEDPGADAGRETRSGAWREPDSATARGEGQAATGRQQSVDEGRADIAAQAGGYDAGQRGSEHAALEALAGRIGLPQDGAVAGRLAAAFVAAPARFLAEVRADEVSAVAALLARRDVARAILAGPRAVSAGDLRRLDATGAVDMARALALLTPDETIRLLDRLLPERSELMRRGILDLRQEAASPDDALRAATLAVLRLQPVDLEALAGRSQAGRDPLPGRDLPDKGEDAAPPARGTAGNAEIMRDVPASGNAPGGGRAAARQARESAAREGTPTGPDASDPPTAQDPQAVAARLPVEPAQRKDAVTRRGEVDTGVRPGAGPDVRPADKEHGARDAERVTPVERDVDASILPGQQTREGASAPTRATGGEAAIPRPPEVARPLDIGETDAPRLGSAAPVEALPEMPGQVAEQSPLVALLALSGLAPEEIALVLPGWYEMEGARAVSAAGDVAAVRAHLEALLAALEPVAAADGFEPLLVLVWRLWPRPAASGDAAEMLAITEVLVRLAARLLPAGARTNAQHLGQALAALEPDPARRTIGLRTVAARLAALPARVIDAPRQAARHAVATLLAERSEAETGGRRETAPATMHGETDWPGRPAFEGGAQAEVSLAFTETAGLVLLHPFYVPLFDRLGIRRDGRLLLKEDLARARGALEFLAGRTAGQDPLHRVLLGLDATAPMPPGVAPDKEGVALMDGLLRSVIERWARLGATSPDGLRETFLRRAGSLRFEPDRVRLGVEPGPFDMLLDSLPWPVGPLRLPWMPLPCFVAWREGGDA